jgi:hypothetical protein
MKEIEVKHSQYPALVDDTDYEYLNQWKWKLHIQGYACRSGWDAKNKKYTCVLMHQVVLHPNPNEEIDHFNQNKLDNQRLNLRSVPHYLNELNKPLSSRNTSGFRGVCFDKARIKWVAKTKHNGKMVNLGRYDTPEKASEVYQKYILTVVPQQIYPIYKAIVEIENSLPSLKRRLY